MTRLAHGGEDLEPYTRALTRGGRQLPAGRHRFSPEFVARSQRDRIIDAMAICVAENGYEGTSVADVIERAGVSRKTFYENFADKESCFLAAYDTIFARILGRVTEAYDVGRRWPDRIHAGLAALLDELAREPASARAGIVEVLAAGPEAIERRDNALRAFQTFYDPSRPEVPDHGVAPIVAEATIGGIYEVIYRRIVTQGPSRLPRLLPELTYLALAPYLGPAAAMRASGLAPNARASVGRPRSRGG